MTTKQQSLATFLEVEHDDLEQSSYDNNVYELGRKEYLVLTDNEADQYASDYIMDSLWAFNASFILDHSKVDMNASDLQAMQEKMCESANRLVKSLIDDIDEFIQDAIGADGRGHFLSSYDGNEEQQDNYFIYRIN